MPSDWPDEVRVDVTHRVETMRGVDGNDIPLHVYRPAGVDGPLPCTVYIHGGGMTILEAHNRVHRRWSEDLAATGMVVVTVGFRNAWTAEGANPFPAGLDDCSSALDWVHAHRDELGITKLVLQGESGGANLVLATVLKARREGRLDRSTASTRWCPTSAAATAGTASASCASCRRWSRTTGTTSTAP